MVGKRYILESLFGKAAALSLAACFAAALLSGCTPSEEAEDAIVMLDQEEEIAFDLAVVSRGDLSLVQEMDCVYQATDSEEIGFPVSGKTVYDVYVETGDVVKKGQLLAELVNGGYDDRIAQYEYEIARNQLIMDSSELNENYEISTQWLQYIYHSDHTEEEDRALKERVAQIQQAYRYQREDCQDAIDLANLELEKLRNAAEDTKIYAGMNGTVTWVQPALKGSSSIQDKTVIEIESSEKHYFVVEDGGEYASLFTEGVPVTMTMTYEGNKQDFLLMPAQMERWGDDLLFTLAEEYEVSLEPGDWGTIRIALDERTDVLTLPLEAVHEADGRNYVYVLGENNLREVKWIEIGFSGNERVEIVSGLEEGERVILR